MLEFDIAEARDIFDRLHARPWLERLERVSALEPASSGAMS